MIKAKATLAGDRPLYLLGISAENVKRLKQGKPICVNLEEMGGAGELLLLYREHDSELVQDLAEFIGHETQVHGLAGNAH